MTDSPQHAVIEAPEAEPASRRISAIWLVPLLALLVSLFVAWRAYDARGPLIEIVLDSAAGIEAGKTTVRFRDVVVGVVEQVAFTEDLR
jgi:paraquat-inducible protein B